MQSRIIITENLLWILIMRMEESCYNHKQVELEGTPAWRTKKENTHSAYLINSIQKFRFPYNVISIQKIKVSYDSIQEILKIRKNSSLIDWREHFWP